MEEYKNLIAKYTFDGIKKDLYKASVMLNVGTRPSDKWIGTIKYALNLFKETHTINIAELEALLLEVESRISCCKEEKYAI